MAEPRMAPCPRCGALAPFAPGNAWRPFCSERCKLIDLGAWASEAYRVPVASPPQAHEGEKPGTEPD